MSKVKVYLPFDVVEAAERRIEWCYGHYDDVYVGWSGGKDSTALAHLTIDVATRLGRLPVKMFWVDQEARKYRSDS